jgi:hypothetical protein
MPSDYTNEKDMPEFLETTADKFTYNVAKDRFYSLQGVWAKEE